MRKRGLEVYPPSPVCAFDETLLRSMSGLIFRRPTIHKCIMHGVPCTGLLRIFQHRVAQRQHPLSAWQRIDHNIVLICLGIGIVGAMNRVLGLVAGLRIRLKRCFETRLIRDDVTCLIIVQDVVKELLGGLLIFSEAFLFIAKYRKLTVRPAFSSPFTPI